jgi:hypothetical protein
MALRLAIAESKRIDIGDGDWIEVVQDISKGDFNSLIGKMPQDVNEETGLTPHQGTKFYEALFDIFVKAWSLEGVPPTLDNYLLLDRESGEKIDNALTQHFGGLTVESPKGKRPRTSRP